MRVYYSEAKSIQQIAYSRATSNLDNSASMQFAMPCLVVYMLEVNTIDINDVH